MGQIDRRRRRDEDGEGESYYVSMSDLMAGVLFLFIIMLTLFAVQLKTAPKVAPKRSAPARAAARAAPPALALRPDAKPPAVPGASRIQPPWAGPVAPPDARVRALTAIADYLHTRGVEAEVDLTNGVLRLSNASLFEGGGSALSQAGRRAVGVLAQAMAEVLPCYAASTALPPAADCPKADKRIGAVFIEGHAEGRPDAWPASVQQASNVFSALIAAEPRLPSLQNGVGRGATGQSVLSVSGYGPSRPIAPGDGRRNNRVDVRLVMTAGS